MDCFRIPSLIYSLICTGGHCPRGSRPRKIGFRDNSLVTIIGPSLSEVGVGVEPQEPPPAALKATLTLALPQEKPFQLPSLTLNPNLKGFLQTDHTLKGFLQTDHTLLALTLTLTLNLIGLPPD